MYCMLTAWSCNDMTMMISCWHSVSSAFQWLSWSSAANFLITLSLDRPCLEKSRWLVLDNDVNIEWLIDAMSGSTYTVLWVHLSWRLGKTRLIFPTREEIRICSDPPPQNAIGVSRSWQPREKQARLVVLNLYRLLDAQISIKNMNWWTFQYQIQSRMQ